MYYNINEAAAKRAKEANSFSSYREGSATEAYRRMVDEAKEIAERQKQRVDEMYHDKIDYYLDLYARKLADNLNHGYEIDGRVPSILIAGASNFPVRKKEKQNAARDTNMEEYQRIQGLLDKIKSIGTGGIMSDDKNAIAKLTAKMESLQQLQERMKKVNAYYRKNKTLEGCPDLDEASKRQLGAIVIRTRDVPYPGWVLSNNNANIHRIKERIEQLEKEAQRAAADPNAGTVEGDGYVLTENAEIGRIQFIFDGKPDAEIRELLKSHGFRWAPSQNAWQRMLNDNGRYAAKKIIESMTKA